MCLFSLFVRYFVICSLCLSCFLYYVRYLFLVSWVLSCVYIYVVISLVVSLVRYFFSSLVMSLFRSLCVSFVLSLWHSFCRSLLHVLRCPLGVISFIIYAAPSFVLDFFVDGPLFHVFFSCSFFIDVVRYLFQ